MSTFLASAFRNHEPAYASPRRKPHTVFFTSFSRISRTVIQSVDRRRDRGGPSGVAAGRELDSALVRSTSEDRRHRTVSRPRGTSEDLSYDDAFLPSATARRVYDLRRRTGDSTLSTVQIKKTIFVLTS